MPTEALVGMTGSVTIELRDARGVPTEVWDQARGVSWRVPPQIQLADPDSLPLDAELSFIAATGDTPVRIGASLDTDPDVVGVSTLELESDDITIAEPPPGQAVSGSIVIVLHQV